MTIFFRLILVFIVVCIFSGSIEAKDSLVNEMFIKRHSGKSYDPTKDVSLDQIYAMIEATRWAPSSHNDQPAYFIVCDRNLTPEAYEKAFSFFKEKQQAWVKNAPLLILVVARMKEIYKGNQNYWGEYDTGAAAMSLVLQATDFGLMAHQIGGFDKEKLAQEFNLPADHKPMTMIIVGHELLPDPNPSSKPRERRPIPESFFLGEWGSGFPEKS